MADPRGGGERAGGGRGGGGSADGGGLALNVFRSAMMKEADGREHSLQLGPSSHERSGEVQREATRASLPIEPSVACSAGCGRPFPCGLPAMRRSKLVTLRPSCERLIVSAPSPSTDASTWNGCNESM